MMTCRICKHAEAAAISLALVRGDSLRDVAGRFKVSKSALHRHSDHLGGTALVKVVEAHREREAETLHEEITRLKNDAQRLAAKAEAEHDYRGALGAVRLLTDVTLRLEELMPTAANELPVKISFSFARSAAPAWNASGEVPGATVPVPELQAPATGIELQVPTSAIPENVSPPEVETEEAKLVRLGFEKLDRLREQDARDEVRSALIQPDYERRGGF